MTTSTKGRRTQPGESESSQGIDSPPTSTMSVHSVTECINPSILLIFYGSHDSSRLLPVSLFDGPNFPTKNVFSAISGSDTECGLTKELNKRRQDVLVETVFSPSIYTRVDEAGIGE